MRFPIEQGSIAYPELKAKLEERFPDYSFTMRGKGVLICKQSSTAGLNILIQRKRMIVNAGFPTLGGMILFAAAIRLRYKTPFNPKAYRIPGGKLGIWFTGCIGIVTCIVAIAIGFLPPDSIPVGNLVVYESILVAGIVVFSIIPLILKRK